MPRILIADDHPLFRDALRYVVERVVPSAEIIEVSGYRDALQAMRAPQRFDLVITDLMMPDGTEAFEGLQRLHDQHPATPIAVVSSREDWPTIRRVIALGATGFIPKSTPKAAMERAILAVMRGERWTPEEAEPSSLDDGSAQTQNEPLTPRQAAVLEQLARGSSNRQIAYDLNIEEITVKAHISAILRKLHVKNRLEAVVATRGRA